MTRIEIPLSDSKPAGLSGLGSLLSSSDADMAHSTDAISTPFLHGMLTQVLEQTTALWKAQASTNHILDEIRQSIPAQQENADVHERLCRVESLVERLVHSQDVGRHPLTQSGQGTDASALTPRTIPIPSLATNSLPPRSQLMPTQGNAPLSPAPHTGREEHSLPGSFTREDEDNMPGTLTVSPHESARGNLLTPVAVASQKQMRSSIPRHGSVPTSITSLAPSMRSGNNSEVTLQSHEDPLRDSAQRPSPLRSLEKTGLNSIQDTPPRQGLMGQPLMRMGSWPMEDRAAARKYDQPLRKIQERNIQQTALDKTHDYIRTLSDTWRADLGQLKEEIIGAVRATANEQVPFNVQGYLDEFSRALRAETFTILNEVGTLHEEKQRIQHELGYLMMMQSAFRSGEFGADRLQDYPYLAARPPPASIPFSESPYIPRPAWRTLPTQASRRSRKAQVPPPPAPVPLTRQHSWTTWKPNPALFSTPPSIEPTLRVPDRGSPGLFGPRSPRDSPRELPRPPLPPRQHSWASWQPSPAWVPTPPSVSSAFLVPDRGSPGLFGPRSPPRSFYPLARQAPTPGSQGSWDTEWDAIQPPSPPSHLPVDFVANPLQRPISLFSSPTIPPVPGPTTPVPGHAGAELSRPRSPCDSLHDQVTGPENQDARDAGWSAWDAWQPSPLIAPTPPIHTPGIPAVQERASPESFGSRSPGDVPGALPSANDEPDSSHASPMSLHCGYVNPSRFGPFYPTS